MLRACLQILRPGGRMAFFTIHSPAGLSELDKNRLDGIGLITVGEGEETPRDQIQRAGFVAIEGQDLTAEYRETNREFLAQELFFAEPLRQHDGDEAFDARIARRRLKLTAIDDGILYRSLFVAQAP